MNKIIFMCNENGEERIFKNCLTISQYMSDILREIDNVGGSFQPLHSSIQINIPSYEGFIKVMCFIDKCNTNF